MQQTKKTAAAPKSNNPFSTSKRHSMPAHEALLLKILECLPALLTEELQDAEPLNNFISANADDWRERIEKLIIAKGLKGSEANLWREIPELRFANPDLERPVIELGTTLFKKTDRTRSSRESTPILVADCSMMIPIPSWHWILLRDDEEASFPKTPISRPNDGLSIAPKISDIPVFGQVFPRGCPLGEVAIEMARLVDAVELHLADDPVLRHSESRNHVMLVTDSWLIFNALVGQYDAVLLPSDDDSATWSFEKLQTFHTA